MSDFDILIGNSIKATLLSHCVELDWWKNPEHVIPLEQGPDQPALNKAQGAPVPIRLILTWSAFPSNEGDMIQYITRVLMMNDWQHEIKWTS